MHQKREEFVNKLFPKWWLSPACKNPGQPLQEPLCLITALRDTARSSLLRFWPSLRVPVLKALCLSPATRPRNTHLSAPCHLHQLA